MKPIKFFFFLILTAILVNSCRKTLGTGDLTVNVSSNFGPAKGARVFTLPATIEGVTDEFGSVLLKNIEAGSYEVFASLPNVGSGKSVVNVKVNELQAVTIQVLQGVNVTFAPDIKLVLPALPAQFAQGETIKFSATVSDDKTATTKLKIKWQSDIDGVLNETAPDANGNIGFETTKLSRNTHKITLTVEDEDKQKSILDIPVSTLSPKPIELAVPTKVGGQINLNWTIFQGENFKQYEVFRSDDCTTTNATLLTTITNKTTLTFADILPPLVQEACYFVRITNTEGATRLSNIQKIAQPGGALISFVPNDILKHPTNPFLYFIDNGAQKLVKFDYINQTIVSSANLPGKMGFCEIGDNGLGMEIYTPCTDGWVYIYDAETLVQKSAISTGLRNSSVVIDGKGKVIVCMHPSPWWEKPVRTYNRANGLPLGGNDGTAFEGSRIRMIPKKNEAITITTSVSPIDMDHLKINDGGDISLTDDAYHGDYPLDARIFKIAPSGEYSITSNSGAVYTANSSMTYRGQVQRGALSFSDFEFDETGATIYAATQNRKSIQIAKYPELTRNNEILTRGFPIFLFRDNKKLIAFSLSTENALTGVVEIINIP
jgi:hypothetical protein